MYGVPCLLAAIGTYISDDSDPDYKGWIYPMYFNLILHTLQGG